MQKEYLDFAKELALKAGEVMTKYFNTEITSRTKDDKSIVTIVDDQINAMVIDAVAQKYPQHSVFGEEASVDNGSELVWVCDPLDGTLPFAKGIPISVFSLALVQDGTPIIGVVYDPFLKKLYSAVKGQGAFVNDEPIKVNDKKLDHTATIDVAWWPQAELDVEPGIKKLAKEKGVHTMRFFCVVQAACKVATGKFEGAVFAGTKDKFVDIAAVKVIVEEAGGKVTDISGNEQRYDRDINGAVITNGLVHDEIIEYLNRSKT